MPCPRKGYLVERKLIMSNKILLTGAGFTHNFGAPLASEVSNLIFNSASDKPQLMELLRNNFDYEAVYQTVMQSENYDVTTKASFTNAMTEAYNIIDKLIKNHGMSNINTTKFKELLKGFNKPNGSGFIFTLNQDLFLDNNMSKFPDITFEIPVQGAPVNNPEYPFERTRLNISYDNFEEFKENKQKYLNKPNSRIFYIKLHGSQDWYKADNNQIMVIGHGKKERIQVEPILDWYFEIFKNQLAKEDTKLLIIGYSFRDEHINRVINNNKHKLKIYIINPQPFEDFCQSLKTKHSGEEIKKFVIKYYCVTLSELLGDGTGKPHPFWNQLQYEFFENQWYKDK